MELINNGLCRSQIVKNRDQRFGAQVGLFRTHDSFLIDELNSRFVDGRQIIECIIYFPGAGLDKQLDKGQFFLEAATFRQYSTGFGDSFRAKFACTNASRFRGH